MKKISLLILIWTSQGFANSEILSAIHANVCAEDAPKNSSSLEAEGICLDCIYGTQSSPKLPEKLKGVDLALKKNEFEKARLQREIEFYKLAAKKDLLKGNGDANIEGLKINIQAYQNYVDSYKKQTIELNQKKEKSELLSTQFKEVKEKGSIGAEFKELIGGPLFKAVESMKKQVKEYEDEVKKYDTLLEKPSLDEVTKQSYTINKEAYSSYAKSTLETYKNYLQASAWFETGGLPVPTYVTAQMDYHLQSLGMIDEVIKSNKTNLELYEKILKELQEKLAIAGAEQGSSDFGEDLSKGKANLLTLEEKARRKLSYQKKNQGFKDCGMTQAEKLAIFWYTGSSYFWLNKALKEVGNAAKEVAPFKEVLESALKKLAPYKGEVHFTANLSSVSASAYQVGAVIKSPAFTSTALGTGSGYFAGSTHKFVVQSKSGRYVGSHSQIQDENEVLFAPNASFQVLSVEGNNVVLQEVEP